MEMELPLIYVLRRIERSVGYSVLANACPSIVHNNQVFIGVLLSSMIGERVKGVVVRLMAVVST